MDKKLGFQKNNQQNDKNTKNLLSISLRQYPIQDSIEVIETE